MGRNINLYSFVLCHDDLRFLKNLIPQISEFSDAVYVIDGGSSDGSWEWLNDNSLTYNIRPYQRKFDWDFSKQRNFLLNKVPKDNWLFVIDSDELPTKIFRNNIRELLNALGEYPEYDRIMLWRVNLHEDYKHVDAIKSNLLRLVYNSNNFEWRSNVHELMHGPWKTKMACLPNEFGLVHLKFLDKQKTEHTNTTYIEKGVYPYDTAKDLSEPNKIISIPKEIEFDVSDELKEQLRSNQCLVISQ